jgi:hypothetical protein
VKEQIMKAMAKLTMAGFLVFGLNGFAAAADMDGAVAYSLGEFDRVGMSRAAPKRAAPKMESGKMQKPSGTKLAQSTQNRELTAQKAEFVRRMFWVALSMR